MSAAPPLVGCALHDGADIDACGCPALDSPGAIAYRGLLVKARAETARLTAELAAARQIADARREWLGTGDAAKSPPRTDTGAIAADMLACAEAWAPGAMLMGNVRADEIAAVCRELAAARAVPADVEAAILSLLRGDRESLDRARAAIARAISEARGAAPATVGGLLWSHQIVEWRLGEDWHQARIAQRGSGLIRGAEMRWRHHRAPSWSSWGQPWGDPGQHMDEPARLVPASEADADPATRGSVEGGGK